MAQLQRPFMLATLWLDTFTDWCRHFISSAKPTAEDPVIKIGYDISCAASGHTQILLPPKLSALCHLCDKKISLKSNMINKY
jgi:hypothetical protein